MKELRSVTITVKRELEELEAFGPYMVAALREYTRAVALSECGQEALETFKSQDGCTLTIHGSNIPMRSKQMTEKSRGCMVEGCTNEPTINLVIKAISQTDKPILKMVGAKICRECHPSIDIDEWSIAEETKPIMQRFKCQCKEAIDFANSPACPGYPHDVPMGQPCWTNTEFVWEPIVDDADIRRYPQNIKKHKNGIHAEMPKYRCHKEVRALHIRSIKHNDEHGATLYFHEVNYTFIDVSNDYVKKHDPAPGDYYVLYEDGYESCSPAEAFESGYTLI